MIITRISLIGAFVLLFCTLAFSQDNTASYIDKHKPLAIDLMREFSIPASVILGVAVIESGAGTSALSRKFNNHFGIVGKNFHSIQMLGHHSHYKEYNSDSASFRHFCEIITRKPYYTKLICNPDPKSWIHAIRKSGYASASYTWGKRVESAIQKFNLTDIDIFVDPLNETAARF
jgi:flagellum-specific peptidoglycan hydrolase FlgJ